MAGDNWPTPASGLDLEAIARQHQAFYQRDLLSWRNAGYVTGIRIEPSPNARCEKAKSYAGCYRIEDAPDYPFGPCDHHENEDVCICGWSPVYEDESVGVVWREPEHRHRLAGPSVRPELPPITEVGYNRLAEVLGIENPLPFVPPKREGALKRFVFCTLLKRHNWRYVILNDEGEKVFECRRCGRLYIAPK